MRVEFEGKVFNNRDFKGYALSLEGCVFLWVGMGNVDTMSLGHFPASTLLLETPGTHGICVKGFTTMVAKFFQEKQVFVSSDIDEEEPRFWHELFQEIKPHLEPLTLDQKIQAISITPRSQ